MDLVTLALVGAVLYFLFQFVFKNLSKGHDHFAKQGIPFLKPMPFFGTGAPLVFRTTTTQDFLMGACNKFPKAKVIGLFEQNRPLYVVKDIELIKQIGIKDFDHFVDHSFSMDDNVDPLFGNVLGMLKGQKWKDMRSTMSPVFTGSKMRQMFDLIVDVGDQLAQYLTSLSPSEREFEMKDVISRFTLDVIASTNFGLQTDSLKDRENQFYYKIRNIINFQNFGTSVKFAFFAFFPDLSRKLGIQIISKESSDFFINLVKDTEAVRKRDNIYRPDLINLIMELRKGTLKADSSKGAKDDMGFATVEESDLGKNGSKRQWQEKELMAQAFVFLLAGFEAVSTAISFIAYELAVNPEVQEKLLREIDEVEERLGSKRINYEVLQTMKYLDQVVSEGLRYWTVTEFAERKCTADFSFENDEGRTVTIGKGHGIWIPIVYLHMSEQYWERPNKFDPERFSDENKHKINPTAYLPFGIGPRNCIGSRFALMETKAALYFLLKSFRIETSEKTQIPLKIMKGFMKLPVNGFWLRLAPRK